MKKKKNVHMLKIKLDPYQIFFKNLFPQTDYRTSKT